MPTLPDPPCPDFGYTNTIQPNVIVSEFGDGYNQVAGDGINTLRDQFTLTYTNIPESEMAILKSFFEAQAGVVPFDWTPPDEVTARKFRCTQWTISPTSHEFYRVTATLIQEHV